MSEEVLLLKEGKWGNETPGLVWAGREQQLLREKKKEETEWLMRALQQTGQGKEMTSESGKEV